MNSFLELGFGFNVNRNKPDRTFHRVALGYLLQSEGGYFSKNTFKLSYNYPVIKDVIKVTPELYFTDKFRTIFPGLSIKF
jgi:hypothetical protein